MGSASSRLTLCGFGASVAVSFEDDELCNAVYGVLRPLPLDISFGSAAVDVEFSAWSSDGLITVRRGIEATQDSPMSREDAEFRIGGAAQLALAEHAREAVFVHAAAVSWNGSAIVVPARSYAGKTRLSQALVAAGARFMSDEYAIVTADGDVRSFPRPMSLRTEGSITVRERIPVPDAVRPEDSIPPSLLAFLSYGEGRRLRTGRISPGEAVLRLLGHAPAARTRPSIVMPALARLAQRAIAIAGERGEAKAAASELLSFAAASE